MRRRLSAVVVQVGQREPVLITVGQVEQVRAALAMGQAGGCRRSAHRSQWPAVPDQWLAEQTAEMTKKRHETTASMGSALRSVCGPVCGEVAAVHVHPGGERQGVAVGAVDGDRYVEDGPADGAAGVDPP
jgi:hypothetical protein